jgi:5-(carboxyamino)imidazole ribonucleotide synthase
MTAEPVLGPGAVLGVVGGGQLGRMFLQAALQMGYRTAVLSPSRQSPAAVLSEHVVEGPLDDPRALGELARLADAITVEFENVSAAGLRWLERSRRVRPGWRSIHVAQNRIREKSFLAANGFPLPRWAALQTAEDLDGLADFRDGAVILKTAASGYDGKGQVRGYGPDGIRRAWDSLDRVPCVVEEVVEFAAEVSCIVARGADGSTEPFPVFWNQHCRHILDVSLAPAPIGPVATTEAQRIAIDVAARLGTVGLLTVEMFLTRAGGLLINELAPRPHNSGHLTIEAAATSQFEQQVRALCGLPLGSGRLRYPAAMANLLGDLWADGQPDWERCLARDPEIGLHLYGKASARAGRKMGHLTAIDDQPELALARVVAARERLRPGRPVAQARA